jgi:hypothetical protein
MHGLITIVVALPIIIIVIAIVSHLATWQLKVFHLNAELGFASQAKFASLVEGEARA